jgi:hypothetical protein
MKSLTNPPFTNILCSILTIVKRKGPKNPGLRVLMLTGTPSHLLIVKW